MLKEELEKAISAAANKDYSEFADAIKPDIEDKFRSAIDNVITDTKATMFGGEAPEPEEFESDDEESTEEED